MFFFMETVMGESSIWAQPPLGCQRALYNNRSTPPNVNSAVRAQGDLQLSSSAGTLKGWRKQNKSQIKGTIFTLFNEQQIVRQLLLQLLESS